MKQIVIGTAGHIDHGKTALVKALTGIDCDRLKEEKERGITIELGFAHYRFGDDLLAGIVDVPGHERFVKHMVAGAWGIDMVLFVIAADESVMPQTREHLDICELLGIKRGIVAITKKDLVEPDIVELVKEEIRDLVKGRFLEGAPVIAVSSVTGENIDLLKEHIRKVADEIQERSKAGVFRLPVDRVFTIKGFGTIVTGTCISGQIREGEEVEIYPTGRRAKVRNIQAYHEDASEAAAGQRVALNLQGVEKQEIERGTLVGRPESLMLTSRIDATFRYLKLPFKAIKNGSILRFHIATTQVEARLVLLDRKSIEPGEEAFAQFIFMEPVVVLPGDRYILRGSYSVQTLGGGTVLDILPKRHARKAGDLARTFSLLREGSIVDRIEYHILKGAYEGMRRETLAVLLGTEEKAIERAIAELTQTAKAKLIGRTLVHSTHFSDYKARLQALLTDFHAKNPLKVGISKEELRTKLPKVEPHVFQVALEELIKAGQLEAEKDKVLLKGAARPADKSVQEEEEQILKKLQRAGLTPPSLNELSADLNIKEASLRDMLGKLAHEGKVAKIKGDMYFDARVIEALKKKVVDHLEQRKEMMPSDFKNLTGVSRKYMIPLLEYFDETRLTIRSGDKRLLRTA
ncbi:MAG TPA: selenocysteine-specific translation elongation factor [Syntrophorhabdales bacterium]|nr:selenocysteine-specific translation elongation factor [Syntrophorhabdales bacterium]